MRVENQRRRYLKLKEIVERELACSAHSMDHVMRVYNLCLNLAKEEKDVDLEVLKTAALLHDIARMREDRDDSGRVDHAALGAKMAERILKELRYPKAKIERVKHCIMSHRFRRSASAPMSKEAKLLFDADKLDAMGAVGIARSFMIAGQYGEKLHLDVDIEDYLRSNIVGGKKDGRIKELSKHSPNIEFETKLRRIPARLHTKSGRKMAVQRAKFMKRFFGKLKKEIDGKA